MFSISIAKQEAEESRAAEDAPVPAGYLAKSKVYQISGFPHRDEKLSDLIFNAIFTAG
jgi:hypothetical protein